jgi:hypothetical protein
MELLYARRCVGILRELIFCAQVYRRVRHLCIRLNKYYADVFTAP